MAATNAQAIKRNKMLYDSIEKRMKEFDEMAKASDLATAVNSIYSDKYKGITPEGNTLVGTEAAAAYIAENCQEMTAKIDEVNGDGEYAYCRGTFKTAKGGGKYITVWKREADEALHVYNECWNYSK